MAGADAAPAPGAGLGRAARFGLRAHLLALVLAVLLPALLFGAAAAWVALRSYQAAAEGRLLDTARALAVALDAHIGDRFAMLGLLAAAPDEVTLVALARRLVATVGERVLLAAPGGELLQETGPIGLARLPDAALARLAGGGPVLLEGLTDPAGEAMDALLLTVLRPQDGQGRIAGMTLGGAGLARLLAGQALAGQGAAALTDAQGLLVARSRDADRVVGQPRPPRPAAPPLGESGVLHGVSLVDGAPIRTAYHQLATAPGWTVWVNEPEASFAAARSRPVLALGIGLLLALAAGLAGATLLGRRVLRPASALVDRAEAIIHARARDDRPAIPAVAVTEFARLGLAVEGAGLALRESEAAVRAVFEQTSVAMAQIDCATARLVRVNKAYGALLDRPAAALLGHPFADFVHAQDQAAALDGFHAICRGEIAGHQAVLRYLRPDGAVRWVEAAASPVRDAAGRLLHVVTVLSDISERRAAEAALRESETRLRRVQRIGRVGGFEIDLRTGVNLRSAEYMDLHGEQAVRTQEQHADWLRRLHPEDRARAEAHFLRAIADDSRDTDYAQEYRVITPGGEVRWIAARAEIERDAAGLALRMLGAHVDVTELKSAEAALRDSEQRLRLALEAAQLGAWEVDLRSGTATRSPRALEIFGFGEEVQQGVYPAFRDRMHPDDRGLLAAAVESVRHGPAERYCIEYRFLHADGGWRWLESHGRVAERDPLTGEAIRLIGTTQDVTARREAQERQALLAREVDHRAKNALAVVQAALRLTPKDEPHAYARAVEGRVAALARAHTLLAEGQWKGAAVRSLAEGELGPFLPPPAPGKPERVALEGPELLLQPAAAQALSMMLHELATNATKHGALSTAEGQVRLAWRLDGAARAMRLRWAERGGPPVVAPPTRRGFGSRVIEAMVEDQLGGELRRHWAEGGLVVEVEIPLGRAVAGHEEAPPAAEPATTA